MKEEEKKEVEKKNIKALDKLSCNILDNDFGL